MLLLVILLFKTTHKHSAEVLSSVPLSKKAAVCLMEKIGMLPKLSSGMSYSSVCHEYNVSEITIWYILRKEEEFIDQYMRLLWEMLESHL